MKKKIIRITTVPMSLAGLLKGQLRFMSNHFNIVGISSSGRGLLKEIAKLENIKAIPVEMTRKITPIKDLIAVYKLYKIFKQEQPYIVHTHTPKAGTLGMLAAKLAKVPYRLHTIAGLPLVESRGMKRILLNAVEKMTYRFATRIFPNSYGLKTIILKHKFTNENKLKVIGNGSSNGIDTSYFNSDLINDQKKNNLRAELNIKESEFVFIFVGRLVTDKGVNELVEAFKNINNKFKNTKLLLVGPYETHMDPLNVTTMEAIKNHENIISVGWQDDVRPYISISNTLVFPSYREGFPNVVLQSGAMKLPCVVTNINGCNEIIKDNVNGIIVPVKNVNKLFAAMNKIYEMPLKQQISMGIKSREIIVSKFEQQFVWNAILEEYNRL